MTPASRRRCWSRPTTSCGSWCTFCWCGPGRRRAGAREGGHRRGRPIGVAMTLDALYPFLSQQSEPIEAVLDDVRRSTEEKAREVVALRQSLVDRHAAGLLACADELAER